MIRYTVVWHREGRDELAKIWIDARDRNAISAAADVIDEELLTDALTKGAELSEGLRALLAPPLRVLFAVREEDRLVEVLCVRRL